MRQMSRVVAESAVLIASPAFIMPLLPPERMNWSHTFAFLA